MVLNYNITTVEIFSFRKTIKLLSTNMREIEEKVHEVLHNLNWLLESHNSFAELVAIKGKKVTIRCVGYCAECESRCVQVAFNERMPEIKLVLQ
ncbi:MAG: NifU family protein [Nitrospirae bacterium]|nr:NifU family protein [Nitrospirota bacterium]